MSETLVMWVKVPFNHAGHINANHDSGGEEMEKGLCYWN